MIYLLAACLTCRSENPVQEESSLKVFMSFSVPIESWKDISTQLEETDGVFVLRGVPNNSFEEFAVKLMNLREAGVRAPIDLDPEAFETYAIDSVPAFVFKGNKITGNLRCDAALREIREKGDGP